MDDKTLVERLRSRKESEMIGGWERVEFIDEDAIEAADRIEALEAALRWYADKDNWRTRGHPQIDWNDKPILHDQGHRAKQALESKQ